jgi:nucleoside-diphosphate-sugar epimerase
MYGELDPYYVTSGLRSAHQQGGTLPRVGNGRALFQQAYAGNVAWAHVLAAHRLSPEGGAHAAGHAYFITDDTPLMNTFTFMEPFLKSRNVNLSARSIPYSIMYALFYVTEGFLRLIEPLYKVNLEANLASLIYINMDVYFKRDRARKMLGYEPLYSFDESMQQSMKYYSTMKL